MLLVVVASGCGNSVEKSVDPPLPPPPKNVFANADLDPKPRTDLSAGVAAGAVIPVSLKTVIDSADTKQGFTWGRISGDVKGPDGRVAIPEGSRATVIIRRIGRLGAKSVVDIGLYSVNIQGRQFPFSDGRRDFANLSFTDDAGKGGGHNSIHLDYNYPLEFKLDTAVQLR